jgi:hypothetical protein
MSIKNKRGEKKRANYQHTPISRTHFMFSGLALQQIIGKIRELNFLMSILFIDYVKACNSLSWEHQDTVPLNNM